MNLLPTFSALGLCLFVLFFETKAQDLIAPSFTDTALVNDYISRAKFHQKFQPDSALFYAKEILLHSKEGAYLKGEAKAYTLLGEYYRLRDEDSLSLDYHHKSIAIYEEVEMEKEINYALNRIGLIYIYRLDYEKSLSYYDKSLTQSKAISDYENVARNYIGLGIVAKRKRDLDQSTRYYESAIAYLDKINGSSVLELKSACYNNLGNIAKKRSQYDNALSYYQACFKLDSLTNNQIGAAMTKENIALLYIRKGAFEKAKEVLLGLEIELKRLKRVSLLAKVKLSLASIYSRETNYTEALRLLEEVLEVAQSKNQKKITIQALFEISRIYLVSEDYLEAHRFMDRSTLLCKELGRQELLILSSQYRGDIFLAQKEYAFAEDYYSQALDMAKRAGLDHLIFPLSGRLGEVFVRQEMFTKAQNIFEHILKFKDGAIVDQVRYDQVNLGMAKCYVHRQKWEKALVFATKVYERPDDVKVSHNKLEAVSLLCQIYEKLNDLPKALEYSFIYNRLSIEIFDTEKERALRRQAKDFYADQQEGHIQDLQKDAELRSLQLSNKNRLITMLVTLSILAGVLALFYFYNNKKEKQLSQLRTNLFANLAHEFRTPISLLQMPLVELSRGTLIGDKKKYYASMLANSNQLLKLTDEILLLSKMEENKIELKSTKQDLILFVKQILIQFDSLAKEHKVKLKLHYPDMPFVCLFDEAALTKVVSNLVKNAVEFCKENDQVDVSVFVKKSHWIIEVKDTGPGISEEELPYIFDRYFRSYLKVVPSKIGGLGLAISKQLVVLHGGEIKVESKLNEGTRIYITIPHQQKELSSVFEQVSLNLTSAEHKVLNEITSVETQDMSFYEALANKEKSLGRKRPLLLVVEDNEDFNMMLAEQLSEKYQVIKAFNGEEGFAKAQQCLPDLILSDIRMPEKDGIRFAKEIAENFLTSHIPIILISAVEDQGVLRKVAQTGVLDFILKPIVFKDLIHKIDNQIRLRDAYKKQFYANISLTEKQDKPRGLSRDEKFMLDLMALINEKLGEEEFSIEKMSQHLHMSRSNLFLKVKALTGKSPSALIKKIRLQKAKKLIEEGRHTVSEAASEVGILNASYFSKIFKTEFGHSPTMTKLKSEK